MNSKLGPQSLKRALLSTLLFLHSAFSAFAASPFYDYKIVARTGDLNGFPAQTVKQLVSVNNKGWVAFVAESASGGKAVFLAEPKTGGFTLHKLVDTTTGDSG